MAHAQVQGLHSNPAETLVETDRGVGILDDVEYYPLPTCVGVLCRSPDELPSDTLPPDVWRDDQASQDGQTIGAKAGCPLCSGQRRISGGAVQRHVPDNSSIHFGDPCRLFVAGRHELGQILRQVTRVPIAPVHFEGQANQGYGIGERFRA